jgi:hypothetical protein
MQLGAFSISLAVKDLEVAMRFYEKFGFRAFAGDAAQDGHSSAMSHCNALGG